MGLSAPTAGRTRPPTRRAAPRRFIVADTTDLVRVLETSHPPTFYIPRSAFGPYLRPGDE